MGQESVQTWNCGVSGDNVTATLSGGTLTVDGQGAMQGYMDVYCPWSESKNAITKVIVTDGVTSIGDRAFHKCVNLGTVTIGNSVTSIGMAAFLECAGLKSVTFGNAVASIGKGAFITYGIYGCPFRHGVGKDVLISFTYKMKG